MELREMAEHLDLAALLARWHVEEWGDLYDGWTLEVAEAEFRAMDRPGRIPTTWVAFADGGRGPGDVLGSISLLADDDLEGYRHLAPWLASLYVVPAARGRGVGRRLVDHAVRAARELGHERVHLFTAGQEAYYADLGWRVVDRPVVRGHESAVMVLDTHPLAPRRALVSRWCTDPDVAGTYSYLRPGGTPADRDRLARPVAPGLHLAGEATWSAHPGTMHGAWFSGERAAAAVLAELRPGSARPRVVVVGAGLAGLAAARRLVEAGCVVVLVEAAPTPGGRIRADASLAPRSASGVVHLGASWLHGDIGNPVAEAARLAGVTYQPATWSDRATYLLGRGRLPAGDQRRLRLSYERLGRQLEVVASTAAPLDAAVGPLARDLVERYSGPDRTDRVVLACWLRSEFEGLYAAPIDDLSLVHHAEPFRLPGGDQTITGSLGRLVDVLAEGLDVRCGQRVRAVSGQGDGRWRVAIAAGDTDDDTGDDTGDASGDDTDGDGSNGARELHADAVVVTVPVGALQSGRLRFDPPLPGDVLESLPRIGPGRVAKVFVTFDEAFWLPDRSFWIAGEPAPAVSLWVDVSVLAGRPTLCGFATGADAPVVERLGEDELCSLAARLLHEAGVTPHRPRADPQA
jgi:GNAT superfamily N-acetyltransferase